MCLNLGRGFMDGNTLGWLRRGLGLSVARVGRCLFCSLWSFARSCKGRRGRRMGSKSLTTPLRWLLLCGLTCTRNKLTN